MKDNDQEILQLLIIERNPEKGLKLLMKTHEQKLYWHIKRLIVDEEKTKDILQETFIKAYQNIEKFNKESKLYTWLYRIATNETLQEVNKLKKACKSDIEVEEILATRVIENSSPNAEEIEILLQKAIQKLPEKQKLVFTLRYYDDLSYEEISKIVDMSVGTLKTNYHYAKEKIEHYIKENFE